MTCIQPPRSLADFYAVVDCGVVSATGVENWLPLAMLGALPVLGLVVVVSWLLRR